MTGRKILVVDDDVQILALVTRFLTKQGFECTSAHNAEKARMLLAMEAFDIILLDINLPDDDGIALTRYIRRDSDTPIIFVSGRVDVIDTIIALEIGGDDFIKKPFELRELQARINTILRRVNKPSEKQDDLSGTYKLDKLLVDLTRSEVYAENSTESCGLTSTEFSILKVLLLKKSNAVSRQILLKEIFGSSDFSSERTVDSHVVRLRKKLTDCGARPDLIKTVYRLGYRLSEVAVEQ